MATDDHAVLEYGILGKLECPAIFGLLRLATEGRPEWNEAIAMIHMALDAGVRVLDTADTYCLDDKELHYGERLAAEAVRTWSGPQASVMILTKAGLARPKGKWLPAGNPRQLRKAVEGSLQALGVERLFLLQLHAKDTKVPFEETLAALGQLQREGLIEHVGLCNVNPAEVRQAQRHFQVATIQNELSVMDRASATDGTVALALQLNIPFIAYRPMGGYAKVEKLDKNRALAPLVKRHGCPPHHLAIAAVRSAGSHVIPLFGARQSSSLQSTLAALTLELDEQDRETLATKISFQPTPEALAGIQPRVIPTDLPTIEPNAVPVLRMKSFC